MNYLFPDTSGSVLQIYHHRTDANYDQPQMLRQIQYKKKFTTRGTMRFNFT